MAELAIRTVFSLAVVLGLLLVLTRVAGRRFRGGSGAVRVVQRQALSRGSALTVVEVGRRTLVLGVTEQQVQVLAELEPGELEGLGEHDGDTPAVQPPPARPRYLTALRPAPAQTPTPTLAPTLASTPAPESGFAGHLLVELDQVAPDRGADLETTPETTPEPVVHPGGGRHAARHRAPVDRAPAQATGALAGSLLSPQTWRQGWQVIGRRAS